MVRFYPAFLFGAGRLQGQAQAAEGAGSFRSGGVLFPISGGFRAVFLTRGQEGNTALLGVDFAHTYTDRIAGGQAFQCFALRRVLEGRQRQ